MTRPAPSPPDPTTVPSTAVDRQRRRLSAAGLVTFIALPAHVRAQGALQEVRLALSWLRDGEFSAVMVADRLGYFAEEGLKVTLVDGGPGRSSTASVAAGQAEAGICPGPDLVRARLAPAPLDVVGLGALTQRMPLAYITLGRPEDPDPVPQDMVGRTVGIQAPGRFYLEAMLRRHGVDPARVKTQVVLANAEPLLFGRVDYFTGFLTNQPYQIEKAAAAPNPPERLRGRTWKAIAFHRWGVSIPGNVVFATGATLRDRAPMLRGLLRGIARGLQFEHEQMARAIELAAAYPGQLDELDKLKWRVPAKKPFEVSEGTRAHGLLWTDPRDWEATVRFFHEVGEIPRRLPVEQVMNNALNPGIRLRA